MNLLAHVAQLTGEHQLHLRVHILDAVFNHELAFLRQLIDILQFLQQHGQFVLTQQANRFEHGDVSHGAQHVVWCQIEVHLAVATHGEAFYLSIDLVVLFPEFHFFEFRM